MPKIACAGNIVADVVARPVSHYPERGVCAHVEQMELHVGGCASNTGLAIAKLGLPTTVIGRVGNDVFGDFVIQELQKHGVDTRGIQRSTTTGTSSTMVMVHPDGERSFIHFMGTNAEFSPDDIDWSLVQECQVFHLAGIFLTPRMDGLPAMEVLQQARKRGLTTTLDVTWDSSGRWMSVLRPCLPYVDYFLPNFGEASSLAGGKTEPDAIAELFLEAGVGTAVIKMAGEGCYVKNRETAFHLPAYSVEVVDMLGAGDCFCAGFTVGLALGWDLYTTARLANAVGALCVTQLGATTGVRPLKETLQWAGIEPPKPLS